VSTDTRPRGAQITQDPVVDACPIGLGAMLTQSGKVISYASQALSSVERCYSQIEREALAVSWGYHHFRMYLLGSHFKVKPDHKSLLHIFNRPSSQASARIDHWSLKLQLFDFDVLYSRDDLSTPDYISRHPRGPLSVTRLLCLQSMMLTLS